MVIYILLTYNLLLYIAFFFRFFFNLNYLAEYYALDLGSSYSLKARSLLFIIYFSLQTEELDLPFCFQASIF